MDWPLPPSPPAHLADSVGLYGITDNLQCLDSKDLWRDFHSAQFAPINTCLKYHDTLPRRDRILVGCDDSGVHLQRFDSTDGSCSEGLVNRVYNPKNAHPSRVESRKVRAWTTVRGNLGVTYNYWTGGKCQEEWDHYDF